jgi:hypothetical protein
MFFTGCFFGANVEGEWRGPLILAGEEEYELLMNLNQSGSDIVGDATLYYSGDFFAGYNVEATVSGEKISGELKGKGAMKDMDFDAKVDGDNMDGDCTINETDTEGTFNLERQ